MAKNIKQHVPVFISSTYKDLAAHRRAVWERLERLKLGVNGMEIFGARPEGPLETSLAEVSKCQYYVAIIGVRYGTVDERTVKSFTRLEYEKAMEKNLEPLIYLINEDKALVSPSSVDKGEEANKLGEFKEYLTKHHTVDYFTTPENLAESVERDLLRLFDGKGVEIESSELELQSAEEQVRNSLRRFDLAPKRYSGTRVEFLASFTGGPAGIPLATCEALGLPYGESVSRPIKISHPSGIQKEFEFLNRVLAKDEMCDYVLDAQNEKEFRFICRLAFGMEHKLSVHSDPSQEFYPGAPVVSLWQVRGLKDLETGEEYRGYFRRYRAPTKEVILTSIETSVSQRVLRHDS